MASTFSLVETDDYVHSLLVFVIVPSIPQYETEENNKRCCKRLPAPPSCLLRPKWKVATDFFCGRCASLTMQLSDRSARVCFVWIFFFWQATAAGGGITTNDIQTIVREAKHGITMSVCRLHHRQFWLFLFFGCFCNIVGGFAVHRSAVHYSGSFGIISDATFRQ